MIHETEFTRFRGNDSFDRDDFQPRGRGNVRRGERFSPFAPDGYVDNDGEKIKRAKKRERKQSRQEQYGESPEETVHFVDLEATTVHLVSGVSEEIRRDAPDIGYQLQDDIPLPIPRRAQRLFQQHAAQNLEKPAEQPDTPQEDVTHSHETASSLFDRGESKSDEQVDNQQESQSRRLSKKEIDKQKKTIDKLSRVWNTYINSGKIDEAKTKNDFKQLTRVWEQENIHDVMGAVEYLFFALKTPPGRQINPNQRRFVEQRYDNQRDTFGPIVTQASKEAICQSPGIFLLHTVFYLSDATQEEVNAYFDIAERNLEKRNLVKEVIFGEDESVQEAPAEGILYVIAKWLQQGKK